MLLFRPREIKPTGTSSPATIKSPKRVQGDPIDPSARGIGSTAAIQLLSSTLSLADTRSLDGVKAGVPWFAEFDCPAQIKTSPTPTRPTVTGLDGIPPTTERTSSSYHPPAGTLESTPENVPPVGTASTVCHDVVVPLFSPPDFTTARASTKSGLLTNVPPMGISATFELLR